MTDQMASFIQIRTGKIFLLLSILVLLFWLLSKIINVYHFAFVGAIFEILWFPVIILTFAIPVVALVFWNKEKFSFRSANLYSLLIAIVAILVMLFF